jgi:putative photosynthetic complex assembly protein
MGERHEVGIPRGVLIAAGLLVVTSIAASGFARVTQIGTVRLADVDPVTTARLSFEDRADGSVVVVDVEDGVERAAYPMGQGGFVRSVLRGLARERARRGLDDSIPFELTRWADGRLSLSDPATGRSVELDAFGPDNARPFLHLLASRG